MHVDGPAIPQRRRARHGPAAGHRGARFAPWNFPNSFWPHTYHPAKLDLEGRIDPATAAELAGMGHDVRVLNDWSPSAGAMSAIVVDHERGTLSAGADARRDSYAIGR